jgi:hypothetical protein
VTETGSSTQVYSLVPLSKGTATLTFNYRCRIASILCCCFSRRFTMLFVVRPTGDQSSSASSSRAIFHVNVVDPQRPTIQAPVSAPSLVPAPAQLSLYPTSQRSSITVRPPSHPPAAPLVSFNSPHRRRRSAKPSPSPSKGAATAGTSGSSWTASPASSSL